jgi:hypothetical protein
VRLIPALLGVLAIGLVATLFAVPILDSTRECPAADEHLEHELTAEAEKVYLAMLAEEPDSDCGRAGMQRVVKRRCREANRIKASAPAEAEKAYVKLLATEPPGEPRYDKHRNAVACALEGLKATATPTPSPSPTPKPAVCRCKSTCTARPAPPCRRKHKSWRD